MVRDSRARYAAALPAIMPRFAVSDADATGAPEEEAQPPLTTATARTPRCGCCTAAITGETRRVDAVTAIVSAGALESVVNRERRSSHSGFSGTRGPIHQ